MVSLRKAFEAKKKHALAGNKINNDFEIAYGNSKYGDANLEIPDDVVDVVDYGHADMTFEEFIQRLDEELENLKEG